MLVEIVMLAGSSFRGEAERRSSEETSGNGRFAAQDHLLVKKFTETDHPWAASAVEEPMGYWQQPIGNYRRGSHLCTGSPWVKSVLTHRAAPDYPWAAPDYPWAAPDYPSGSS